MTTYEFNILMYTKLCEAYSNIKKADITSVSAQFSDIINQMQMFYDI